jgi:hypothetical protein
MRSARGSTSSTPPLGGRRDAHQSAQGQSGPEPSAGAGPQSTGQAPGQEDVVEADYEIVDDKK